MTIVPRGWWTTQELEETTETCVSWNIQPNVRFWYQALTLDPEVPLLDGGLRESR